MQKPAVNRDSTAKMRLFLNQLIKIGTSNQICPIKQSALNEEWRMGESLFVGGGGESYATPQQLLLKYGNRHGLIAGATGPENLSRCKFWRRRFRARASRFS